MSKKNIIKGVGIIILTFVVVIIIVIYGTLFGKVDIAENGIEIFIPNGAIFEQVKDTLRRKDLLVNETAFDLLSKRKSYPDNIKSGRYIISDNMSYNDMMNLLRAGNQAPMNITFNNVRTLPDLAARLSLQLEIDSITLLEYLSEESNYSDDGFSKETIMAVFIPNTYEMYWTISASDLYKRMLKEFNRFWTDDRKRKAMAWGLDPVEVSTLASIVDDEVAMEEEKPIIAGVYLNRIERNMHMQSCPTIKFALNDFTIRRVLNEHLVVDSPYNTYKHLGLPPGPVRCATISGIEAVLNAESHNYLYFVARYDFSGYHHFSTNLNEHLNYANRYWSELDKKKIYN